MLSMLSSLFLDECNGICGDALLASSKAQLFGCCSLDADGIYITADDVRHALLHLWDVWVHLGALSTDGGIDIHQLVTFGSYQLNRFLKDNLTIHSVGLCRGVREVIANIAHVGGTEYSVADSMYQHVGITMPQ